MFQRTIKKISVGQLYSDIDKIVEFHQGYDIDKEDAQPGRPWLLNMLIQRT